MRRLLIHHLLFIRPRSFVNQPARATLSLGVSRLVALRLELRVYI